MVNPAHVESDCNGYAVKSGAAIIQIFLFSDFDTESAAGLAANRKADEFNEHRNDPRIYPGFLAAAL